MPMPSTQSLYHSKSSTPVGGDATYLFPTPNPNPDPALTLTLALTLILTLKP